MYGILSSTKAGKISRGICPTEIMRVAITENIIPKNIILTALPIF